MKSNYEKLGKYIREVKNRNTDLKVNKLLGLSTQKEFRSSTSNIIGTDMSTYRVIGFNQFVYMPVTDTWKGLAVALYRDSEPIIVSQIYKVFEIIDTNNLDPDYLMMWFRRPEINRYARFKSHGSAREIFDWEELCDLDLPVPHIDKQREIVAEYNTILQRIDLNNQLIQKLEETAQAIYKQWFVDFEFPNENGEPYKSAGGEMVESELGDIPAGWKVVNIKNWGTVITGKTPSSENPKFWGNEMPFVTPTDFKNYGKFILGSERKLSADGISNLKTKVLKPNSVIVTCIGSDMGKVVLNREECITNQQMNSIVTKENFYKDYLYYYIKSISSELKSIALGGSTMPLLNKTEFEKVLTIKPSSSLLQNFDKVMRPINNMIWSNAKITNSSFIMKDLLLSKLATVTD